jgi:hypothetical protein
MPQTQKIELSAETSEQVRSYAAEVGIDAEEIAEEALGAGLLTLRRFRFFAPRDPNVDTSDARELLRRAGNEPPQPGDELPEGYKPIA